MPCIDPKIRDHHLEKCVFLLCVESRCEHPRTASRLGSGRIRRVHFQSSGNESMRASLEKQAETTEGLIDPNEAVTSQTGRTAFRSAESKIAATAASNSPTNPEKSAKIETEAKMYLMSLKKDIEEYLRKLAKHFEK